MHRATMTTSLCFISTAFLLTQEAIAASTRSLGRSLKGFLQMPPRLRNLATSVLRMTLFFISCKSNGRAKLTRCKPMSFQYGSRSSVLTVDDVENTLTVL